MCQPEWGKGYLNSWRNISGCAFEGDIELVDCVKRVVLIDVSGYYPTQRKTYVLSNPKLGYWGSWFSGFWTRAEMLIIVVNQQCQTWQQEPLPTMPPHWPSCFSLSPHSSLFFLRRLMNIDKTDTSRENNFYQGSKLSSCIPKFSIFSFNKINFYFCPIKTG